MGVLKFSFFLVAFIAYTQAKPVDPKLHIEIAGKPVADIDTSSLTPRGRKIVNEIMSEMQPIIEEADILTKKVKHDSRSMDPIRKDQYKKSMDALTKSIEHHVHHANKKLEKEIKTRTRSGGVDLNNVPVYHLIENALHKLQFIPEFVLCNIMGCGK